MNKCCNINTENEYVSLEQKLAGLRNNLKFDIIYGAGLGLLAWISLYLDNHYNLGLIASFSDEPLPNGSFPAHYAIMTTAIGAYTGTLYWTINKVTNAGKSLILEKYSRWCGEKQK